VHLLICVFDADAEPSESRPWPEAPGSSEGQPVVRVLHDATKESIRWALRCLLNETIWSAAVLREVPKREELWVVYEWRGHFVTDAPLSEIVGVDDRPWRLDTTHNQYFIWQAIGSVRDGSVEIVESAADFGDRLASPLRFAIFVDVDDVNLDDVELFRGYAASQNGGSAALMSLCGAGQGDSTILLRNPAAVELEDMLADQSSASHFQNTHAISTRAIGVGSAGSVELSLRALRDPEGAARVWAETDRDPSSFWIIAELAARVDPEVIIPAGSIFEQESLNGVQTLAAAVHTSAVIDAGQSTALAIPAWCLNQRLSPPRGQPLRMTPLRARYQPHTSQDDVWSDRDRIVSSDAAPS
jgi:hypothetical protein